MAPTTNGTVVLQGDEEQLYHQHAPTLRGVVRMKVNTTDENVDDACAFAWMQLVRHQPRRNTVFAWLRTVATREAIRLDRIERRHTTVDLGALEHPSLRDHRTDSHAQDDLIDVLMALAVLSDRQRRTLGLCALGFRHKEIAEVTGDSARRVARLIVRARRAALDAKNS